MFDDYGVDDPLGAYLLDSGYDMDPGYADAVFSGTPNWSSDYSPTDYSADVGYAGAAGGAGPVDDPLGAFLMERGYEDMDPGYAQQIMAGTSNWSYPDRGGAQQPQSQGVLNSLMAQAQKSWEADPLKWITTIGGGALGLYTGLQQQDYYKKLIEEQRRREEEARKRQQQSNRPLFEGRPPAVPSAYDFNADYARYGAGPEHAFRTAGPSFSRADFAGAAGGPLSRLVQGAGGGQDDNVVGALSPGEFVVPADVVSDLGDGSNEAGADKLLQLMKNVRHHKGRPKRLPPKSKKVKEYLK